MPRTKFPTYLVTPLFPPPASFWSSSPVRGVFASLDMIHLCGPTFQEVSKDYPGADFIGAHTNFSAEDFARMVAKSAFVQPFLPWGSDHLSTLRSERSSSGPILALGTGWLLVGRIRQCVGRQNSVPSEINHLGRVPASLCAGPRKQHTGVTLLLCSLKTEYCSTWCLANLLQIDIRPPEGNFDDPQGGNALTDQPTPRQCPRRYMVE